ncbi:hypothetical protein PBY51_017153 [Eleginops maclovinus]|uniref:Uncharacterized protein n=1 Tax=Eleginops maclovinus TaxID=56733 RepID=A0AAN7XJ45_ELEMC|nr:hypothetical protein PBY51_017153 [Eleginops maclovinus]
MNIHSLSSSSTEDLKQERRAEDRTCCKKPPNKNNSPPPDHSVSISRAARFSCRGGEDTDTVKARTMWLRPQRERMGSLRGIKTPKRGTVQKKAQTLPHVLQHGQHLKEMGADGSQRLPAPQH